MRIECENCDATYTIDDAQLSDQPIGAQCPYCGHVKLVRRGDEAEQVAQPAFGVPGGDFSYDPFGGVGQPAAPSAPAPSPAPGPASGFNAPMSGALGVMPKSGVGNGLGYSQGPAVGGLASTDLSSADLGSNDVGAFGADPMRAPASTPFGSSGPFDAPPSSDPFAGDAPAALDAGPGAGPEPGCQVCGVPLMDEFDKVIGLCDEHQRERQGEGAGGPPAADGSFNAPGGDFASSDLGGGAAHWHVRRQGGGVEGPMTLEDLRNRIRSSSVSVADEFSSDGVDFGPISRFKDIAYLASLAGNDAASHLPSVSSGGGGSSIALGKLITPVLTVLLLGGVGFLAYQNRDTLTGMAESLMGASAPTGPSTPNPLKRYLTKWRLKHPDLSGSASEHLVTARARHLEDSHSGYQAAERAFERALLLNENEVEAIAGYVENLALWNYASTTVDKLRVVEAAAHYARELDPESPHPHRALGALALAKGDLNGCRAGADGALQRAPSDGRAKLLLAGCFLQGNVQLAIDEAERAKRMLPELRRADRLLARAYAEAGRFTSAFGVLDGRLAVDPNNARVHLHYAEVARQLGDRSLAQRHLKKAASLPGDKQGALLALAELAYENREFPSASRYYSQAAKARAMHGARASSVYSGWASSELMRKRASRAIKLADQALSFSPNDAAGLLVRGQAALMAGSATTAIAYARRTLTVRTGEPAALVLQARALVSLGQKEQAVRSLEEAITNDPRDTRIKGILAAVYLSVGGVPQAYTLMKRAAEIDPLEANSRARVGPVALSPLPVQEALSRFRKSAGEERNASVASSAMGMMYYHLGDRARARASIARALKLDSANTTALIYSAQLSLDRDEIKAATKAARKLLAVERGSALGHLLLGRALAAKRDFDSARREYESALRSNPGLLAAKVELASIAMEAGNREEAVKELTTAFHINPYNLKVRRLMHKAGI